MKSMIKRTPQEIADFFGCYVVRDEASAAFDIYTEQPVVDHEQHWWLKVSGDVIYLTCSIVPEEYSDKDWTVLYSPDSRTNQQADEGISPESGDAGSYFGNNAHPDNKGEANYTKQPDSDNKHQYEVHTHAEYKVVSDCDTAIMSRRINELLAAGWKLCGGISARRDSRAKYGAVYYQAMVRGV